MAGKISRNTRGNGSLKIKRRNSWIPNKGTEKRRKLKPLKCLFNFVSDYCNRSSLHGLRYITEPGAHWMERLIWAFLFTLSVLCTVTVISKLSARFQTAETSTVVETTSYPVSNLPFPSVTLCPSDRVDWQKALEMEKDIVPPNDQDAIETYRQLVTVLSTITFADFDSLEFLRNRSLTAFQGMNLTNFLRNVAPSCSKLLSDCWWRNSDRNCCDVFEPQRTEYGFCYSFNSETADISETRYRAELRPRRSNLMGDWGGIRFTVNMNKSIQPPETEKALGVTLFVGHPNSWPSNGRDTGLGMQASVSVQCPSSYATERVLQLPGDKLPCIPHDETSYNQNYCMTVCRRNYVIARCGCNPYFLMPLGPEQDCTFDDLLCLINDNGFFNNYVLKGNPYFTYNDAGMNCTCPAECNVYGYTYQVSHNALRGGIATNSILVDVHYEASTMMRYRMDIVYTQLDLLVSFGGVVGLFLGGSILSAVELLYYLTAGLITQALRRSQGVEASVDDLNHNAKNHNKSQYPIATVYPIFPLMDYHQSPPRNFYK